MSTEIPFIVKHFWLFCGLFVGFGNAIYYRLKLRSNIRNGEFSQEEVNRFTRNFALWVLIPSLLFWGLQLSAGSEFAPIKDEWPKPQKYFVDGLQVFLWCVLIYYIFFKNGAEQFSRYLMATHKLFTSFYKPVALKIVTVFVVVSGAYTYFFR